MNSGAAGGGVISGNVNFNLNTGPRHTWYNPVGSGNAPAIQLVQHFFRSLDNRPMAFAPIGDLVNPSGGVMFYRIKSPVIARTLHGLINNGRGEVVSGRGNHLTLQRIKFPVMPAKFSALGDDVMVKVTLAQGVVTALRTDSRRKEMAAHFMMQSKLLPGGSLPVPHVYGFYNLLLGNTLVAMITMMHYYSGGMQLALYQKKYGTSRALFNAYQNAVLGLWRHGVALTHVNPRDVLVVPIRGRQPIILFMDLKSAVNLSKQTLFKNMLETQMMMAQSSTRVETVATIWQHTSRTYPEIDNKFRELGQLYSPSPISDYQLGDILLDSLKKRNTQQRPIRNRLGRLLSVSRRGRRNNNNDEDENNTLDNRSRAPKKKPIRMRKIFPDDREREQWKPRDYSVHWSMSQTRKQRRDAHARWAARTAAVMPRNNNNNAQAALAKAERNAQAAPAAAQAALGKTNLGIKTNLENNKFVNAVNAQPPGVVPTQP